MAAVKSRPIKDIYSDENSNSAAVKPHPPSSSTLSGSSSRQSVSRNECTLSQGQEHNQSQGPALIRCDSRVSIVSDANSYRERREPRSSTYNAASRTVTSGDEQGEGADSFFDSLGGLDECPYWSGHPEDESGSACLMAAHCDAASQMLAGSLSSTGRNQLTPADSSKRGKRDGVKVTSDLQLEFIQVAPPGTRRAAKGNKSATQVSPAKSKRGGRGKHLHHLTLTSNNPAGSGPKGLKKKKRPARGGLVVEEEECRLKRDKKCLLLTCESPTVSEQSALSKVALAKVGSPLPLDNSQRNRTTLSHTHGLSDTDISQCSGGMGELSPVSVLCPASSNNSSLEATVAWTDFSMDVCTPSDAQAAEDQLPDQAPPLARCSSSSALHASSHHERQQEVIFQDGPQVQFLLKDPAAAPQNVQESQIRSLMTSMLHEISGSKEIELLEAAQGNSDVPLDSRALHHAPRGDVINSVPSQQSLDDTLHDCTSMDGASDEFSKTFRQDLHIEDFEVEFLKMLQGDARDCSTAAPGSSTGRDGYYPPHDFHGEFQGGGFLQPPSDLEDSTQASEAQHLISLDESGQDEAANGSHHDAQGGPLQLPTPSYTAQGQLKAPPSAAATAFQHQWAPPWGATPDGASSDSEYNGIRLVHLLLAGAEAVATSNIDLVSVILLRLKELSSKSGSTMQRVAAYFCEGLQCRVDQAGLSAKGGNASALVDMGKCDAVADMLGAFQILHEISPYIKFAHFTANQSILEAFENEKRVHIIDYEIMEGMQWPSLMQALACRPEGPPHLRITALCRGSSGSKRAPGSLIATVQETGRRLSEFAASLHIPFSFHQAKVDVENSQEFRPAVLKLVKGEAIAVNCMLHLPHMGSGGSAVQSRTTLGAVHAFFTAMHKLSPAVMTVVEEELSCCFSAQGGPGSFVNFFFQALHHYSAIFDSLEASLAPDSTVRHMVERIFLAPRIASLVANFSSMGHNDAAMEEYFSEAENHHGRSVPQKCSQSLPSGLSEGGFETLSSCQIYNFSTEDVMRKNEGSTPSSPKHWSSLAFAGGFVPTQTSYKSQWQAKLLLSLFRDGYRLEQRDHRLVLGWRSFPLISASAWRCKH